MSSPLGARHLSKYMSCCSILGLSSRALSAFRDSLMNSKMLMVWPEMPWWCVLEKSWPTPSVCLLCHTLYNCIWKHCAIVFLIWPTYCFWHALYVIQYIRFEILQFYMICLQPIVVQTSLAFGFGASICVPRFGYLSM